MLSQIHLIRLIQPELPRAKARKLIPYNSWSFKYDQQVVSQF